MKKLTPFLVASLSYLSLANLAFAAIEIQTPKVGYPSLGVFITNAISLAFIIAAIAVLVMLIWGAIEWIFSGGEKEAVGKARNRILNALIGLAILAVAVAIAQVFGTFVGINLFKLEIPSPGNINPTQPPPPPNAGQ